MSFAGYILTSFALVFVIEGLLYALFPDAVRRMMAIALTIPTNQFRSFGFVMAVTGFAMVLLLRRI
jgi:uncharacterized protein YjeT (DUF2065 family)